MSADTVAGPLFAQVQQAPPDPILGLTEAFLADNRHGKVNLGVGVYQNGDGKVPVLSSVRKAEAYVYQTEESKSYLPIDGLMAYNKQVQQLLLGSGSEVLSEGRAVTVQALGGTGALKIGADFLNKVCGSSAVWISNPSWENHRALFEAAGLTVNTYPYYDAETHGVNFEALTATLNSLEANSVVLLHACCHNPTGADLTTEQWDTVVSICKEKSLLPFLDFAYQGFAVGIQEDAYAVRAFAASGQRFLIANSFSKSFSLYRERVGALTVVAGSAEEARILLSQIKRVIRTNYSNPASHGAQVVSAILNSAELRAEWEQELADMRVRIHEMRARLLAALEVTGKDFEFIVNQKGMFSYSGLEKSVVHHLRSEYGIYIVDSGRICVAALNQKNVEYVAIAIANSI
jgi:aromatic-amino-acid transaminase